MRVFGAEVGVGGVGVYGVTGNGVRPGVGIDGVVGVGAGAKGLVVAVVGSGPGVGPPMPVVLAGCVRGIVVAPGAGDMPPEVGIRGG